MLSHPYQGRLTPLDNCFWAALTLPTGSLDRAFCGYVPNIQRVESLWGTLSDRQAHFLWTDNQHMFLWRICIGSGISWDLEWFSRISQAMIFRGVGPLSQWLTRTRRLRVLHMATWQQWPLQILWLESSWVHCSISTGGTGSNWDSTTYNIHNSTAGIIEVCSIKINWA